VKLLRASHLAALTRTTWESKFAFSGRQAATTIYKTLHENRRVPRAGGRIVCAPFTPERLEARYKTSLAVFFRSPSAANRTVKPGQLESVLGRGDIMNFYGRIRRGAICFGLAILAGGGARSLSAGSPPESISHGKVVANDLVIHEWGTFLGMSGSDGVSLDGMYHEEHALPAFVHGRSRDSLRLPFAFLKGETPVIYFYTKERRAVQVGVGFPRGVWTQWYPQASLIAPSLAQTAQTPDRLNGGQIYWQTEVIPVSSVTPDVALPVTSTDALWKYAREVDAAYVKTSDGTKNPPSPEFERFLFYRGLGEARLPVRLDSRQNGTLELDSDQTLGEGVRQVFVLRIENGRGAYRFFPALKPGERVSSVIPSMTQARPLAEFTRAIADDLTARLAESGLYAKEARAMVNTWTTSYFQTDGIRALFVMPQCWTDAFIPMTVKPLPQQIVRVMVGRLEVLTHDREKLAETAIHDLTSNVSGKRQRAFRYLHEQGRYVEPIVRRVLKTTTNDDVRTICRRLLLTEFVTELRAAVHNAADGKTFVVDPVLLRAHLARLLREIGCLDEARAEAEAVLAALKKYPLAPNQTLGEHPAALEIRGAAAEATGDDRKASAIYARRIELQMRTIGEIDANTIAWLRDWWVGRAYAQCLLRTPGASVTVTELERYVSQCRSTSTTCADQRSSRLFLAFLLDCQGKAKLGESQWSELIAKPKLEAVKAPQPSTPAAVGLSGD
jgi:hypothetical protein